MVKKIFAMLIVAPLIGCIDYSEGDRSGVLTKFARKGLICKTWEGEMNLGGLTTTESGMVANVWQFSIDSEIMADQKWVPILKEALEKGKRIKIGYNQEAITGPCRSNSDYFVKSVMVLE